ncbi:methionine aminopeptidase 2 isoform X1 [Ixodes scapularis]
MAAVLQDHGGKHVDEKDDILEDGDEEDDVEDDAGAPEAAKKKKKRKKKKKKAPQEVDGENHDGATAGEVTDLLEQQQLDEAGEKNDEKGDAEEAKKKKKKKPKGPKQQTDPPSIPICDLFPDGNFPVGQEMEYPIPNDSRTGKNRMTDQDKKAMEGMSQDQYKEIRQAAEAHRQVSPGYFIQFH